MKKHIGDIVYEKADAKGLELVGPLWQKLIKHHRVRSRHFQEHFDRMTWEIRKKELLEKSLNGMMLVDLAKDSKTGEIIGYCVSTINEKEHGEIESIFIEDSYRRGGIGGNFIKRGLNWEGKQSITRKIITVGGGNERKFGF